jgi:hypothetical protein
MTREEDLNFLSECKRSLGLKLWELPPWRVDSDDEDADPAARRLRKRMERTEEGRQMLRACEAACDRLWPDR